MYFGDPSRLEDPEDDQENDVVHPFMTVGDDDPAAAIYRPPASSKCWWRTAVVSISAILLCCLVGGVWLLVVSVQNGHLAHDDRIESGWRFCRDAADFCDNDICPRGPSVCFKWCPEISTMIANTVPFPPEFCPDFFKWSPYCTTLLGCVPCRSTVDQYEAEACRWSKTREDAYQKYSDYQSAGIFLIVVAFLIVVNCVLYLRRKRQ